MSEAKKLLNDTLAVERPPIKPMSFTKPYWDGTRDKKLIIQYCPDTKKYQFFPRPMSLYTGKRNLEWREVPGNGVIYSYTITRRTRPPFRGHEPFAIAMVELDEGVRIMGDLIHVAEADIKIGMKVKPFWIPLPEGYNQLAFEPR
jgi:uncharacterized OB-fold protein